MRELHNATEELKQQMQQTLPTQFDPAFVNVPIEAIQIAKVHEFPSLEAATPHLQYIAVLEKLSIQREQAAMAGDRMLVEEIDDRISAANKEYREQL